MNNNFAEAIGYIVAGLMLIFIASIIGGTFLWLVWEDSVTAMFPNSVENGILAATLTWWQAVKISWVFNILLGSTKIDNKQKEK